MNAPTPTEADEALNRRTFLDILQSCRREGWTTGYHVTVLVKGDDEVRVVLPDGRTGTVEVSHE